MIHLPASVLVYLCLSPFGPEADPALAVDAGGNCRRCLAGGPQEREGGNGPRLAIQATGHPAEACLRAVAAQDGAGLGTPYEEGPQLTSYRTF